MSWSSVKQLRTVLETEYSIDDIFGGLMHFFARLDLAEKLEKDAKSKKVKQADGFSFTPFHVTDQITATSLYYREVPLPW